MKEMKVKIIMKFCFILVRMGVIKKVDVGKNIEKEGFYILWVGM